MKMFVSDIFHLKSKLHTKVFTYSVGTNIFTLHSAPSPVADYNVGVQNLRQTILVHSCLAADFLLQKGASFVIVAPYS